VEGNYSATADALVPAVRNVTIFKQRPDQRVTTYLTMPAVRMPHLPRLLRQKPETLLNSTRYLEGTQA
jgi:hypothetical protein